MRAKLDRIVKSARDFPGEAMKVMYCWRCGRDVAMLDEDEFAVVDKLYYTAVRTIKERSRHWDAEKRTELLMQQYAPSLDAYRKLTGTDHVGNPSELLHHRISIYGPICENCGKPLRTPRASHCVACGKDRSTES